MTSAAFLSSTRFIFVYNS